MTGAITDAVMLVFSHLLAEFVLQPDSWLKKKKEEKHKSVIFILHALLAGALAYVFLAEWHAWYIIPAVAILHGVIDSWRMSRKTDNLTVFAIDQGLHLLSLAAVWLVFHSDLVTLPIQWSNSIWTNMVVHISAIIILTYPVGMVIGYFTKKWREELDEKDELRSLKSAGRWIGNLERTFIYLSVITGNFSAIGFLIAAKSVLRLNGMRNEVKMAEYILIGTLMSFLLAIIVGMLAKSILENS